jgi:peptidoglycan/xylan/chitin deacetylase (PgdA/CDA1 family)
MKHRFNILLFAVNLTWISFLLKESPYFVWALVGASLLFVLILSVGVINMRFNYFLPALTRLNSEYCLLTFDDGPDETLTPHVLDTLQKYEIAAVFFVIGTKAESHPALIHRMLEEGHLIGNHSYAHHPFMSLFSLGKLREDIGKAQLTLEKLTGKKPHLFRPPIGYTNPRFARVLGEKALLCVGWTLRSFDSVQKTPGQLARRLLRKIKPGQIILLHDNLKVSADALEEFIVESRKNGIKFVSSANIKEIIHA